MGILDKILVIIAAINLTASIIGIDRTRKSLVKAKSFSWNNRLESYFIFSYRIKLRFYQLIILYEFFNNNKFILNYKSNQYKNLLFYFFI